MNKDYKTAEFIDGKIKLVYEQTVDVTKDALNAQKDRLTRDISLLQNELQAIETLLNMYDSEIKVK